MVMVDHLGDLAVTSSSLASSFCHLIGFSFILNELLTTFGFSKVNVLYQTFIEMGKSV
ncbi:hypothetical protein YC2023_048462 [Brassica napus]